MSDHQKYTRAFNAYGQKLFDQYKAKYPDHEMGEDAQAVFAKIAQYDPTHNAKDPNRQFQNLDWMVRQLLEHDVRPQDIYKIRDDLTLFSKKGKTIGNANLDSYTLPSLAEAMFPFLDELSAPSSAEKKRQERQMAEQNSKIFYDGPEGKVLMPLTMEASQFWGRGTRWCISATESDNLFDKYYRRGEKPIVMFLPAKTQEKYAFNIIDGAMRDPKDAETRNVSEPLLKLMHRALTNPDAKQAFEAGGKPVNETLQQGVMAVPGLYGKLLNAGSAEDFPKILAPEKFVEDFVRKSQDMDWWAVSMGRLMAPSVFSSPVTLAELSKYSPEETESIRVELSHVELMDNVFQNTRHEFDLDESNLETPEKTLSALKALVPRVRELYELLDDAGYEGFDHTELAITHFMKQIPVGYWDDVEFAMDFIHAMPHIRTGLVVDDFPEILQHPEVVMYFVDDLSDGNEDMVPNFLKSVPNISDLSIGGQQVFDAALPQKFDKVLFARDFAEAAQDAGIRDLGGLSRKIISEFRSGVESRQDLEILLYDLDALEVTPVVEATIEKHPDWFEDVPALKQTPRMAEIAVAHNPESLLDVRSDFLRAHDARPAVFEDAYGKLGQGAAKTSLAPFFGSQQA